MRYKYKLTKQISSDADIVMHLKRYGSTTAEALKLFRSINVGEEVDEDLFIKLQHHYYTNITDVYESDPNAFGFKKHPTDEEIKEAEDWVATLSEREQRFIQIIKDSTFNFNGPIG